MRVMVLVKATGESEKGLRNTPEEKQAFEDDYSARLLNPYVAAERGYVDVVIPPHETRAEIVRALRLLKSKRETLPAKKHGNIPL